MAYLFLLVYAIGVLLIILFGEESDGSLLQLYLMFVPAPVIIGCVASIVFYRVAVNHDKNWKRRVKP